MPDTFQPYVHAPTDTRLGDVLSSFFLKDPQTKQEDLEVVFVASSNIVWMSYSTSRKEMTIEFRKDNKQRGGGPRYVYYHVPYAVFLALKQSGSKGRYFYYNIRGPGRVGKSRFAYRKIR